MSTPGHALDFARRGWALDDGQIKELVALIDERQAEGPCLNHRDPECDACWPKVTLTVSGAALERQIETHKVIVDLLGWMEQVAGQGQAWKASVERAKALLGPGGG